MVFVERHQLIVNYILTPLSTEPKSGHKVGSALRPNQKETLLLLLWEECPGNASEPTLQRTRDIGNAEQGDGRLNLCLISGAQWEA